MTDIVGRLRAKHENRENPWAWQEAIEIYERERDEAADEIESLRKELSSLTIR